MGSWHPCFVSAARSGSDDLPDACAIKVPRHGCLFTGRHPSGPHRLSPGSTPIPFPSGYTPRGGGAPKSIRSVGFGRVAVLVASHSVSRFSSSRRSSRRASRAFFWAIDDNGGRRGPAHQWQRPAGGSVPPPLVFVLSQGRRPVRLRSSRWARPPGSPSATRGSAVVKCGLGRDLMSRPILRIFSRRLSPLWVGGTAVYRTVSKRGPKTSYSTVKPKGNLRKTLPRTNSEGLRLVSPCPVSRSHSVKEDVTR